MNNNSLVMNIDVTINTAYFAFERPTAVWAVATMSADLHPIPKRSQLIRSFPIAKASVRTKPHRYLFAISTSDHLATRHILTDGYYGHASTLPVDSIMGSMRRASGVLTIGSYPTPHRFKSIAEKGIQYETFSSLRGIG